MELGHKSHRESPIIHAIAETEKQVSVEIRVHISRRWWEPNALKRAQRIFERFGQSEKKTKGTILLYVNVHAKKFALVGQVNSTPPLSKRFWDKISNELIKNLRSTHYENAIALSVRYTGMQILLPDALSTK